MQTIWSACVLTKTVFGIYRACSLARAYIHFEFNVQFISRDYIADVDVNDVSVYMEID